MQYPRFVNPVVPLTKFPVTDVGTGVGMETAHSLVENNLGHGVAQCGRKPRKLNEPIATYFRRRRPLKWTSGNPEWRPLLFLQRFELL
jgi:hypothetical protein